MIDLVEKFITIGGEAPLIGTPIYLIRCSGCNLNCVYCDTPYKDEVNDNFTVKELQDDISAVIKNYPDLKILFTGGEPLFGERQAYLLSIIKELDKTDFYIETNGSINIANFDLPNCYYVVDWKSPSSGENESFCIDNLKKLRIDNDCIKFVAARDDLDWLKEALDLIYKVNPFVPLYISPQWDNLTLKEASEFILNNRLPLKLSFQLHKYIWPDRDRGV